MRQLKRAISNWAQYRANCRSMASGNTHQACFTMTQSHRSRYSHSRSRSSAPCTPSMSKTLDLVPNSPQPTTPSPRKTFQINGHKREESSKTIKEKSSCIGDDVNYVIPIFSDNEEIRETTDAEYSHRKSYERCEPFDRQVNNSDEKCIETRDAVDKNAYMEVIAT